MAFSKVDQRLAGPLVAVVVRTALAMQKCNALNSLGLAAATRCAMRLPTIDLLGAIISTGTAAAARAFLRLHRFISTSSVWPMGPMRRGLWRDLVTISLRRGDLREGAA